MANEQHRDDLTEELESNIVELTDEDGQTVEFEYLTTIEHEGESYVVLLAPQEEENDEEGEVVILKIQQDENGEDTYVTIDNPVMLDEVFSAFLEFMDEAEEDGEK